MKTHAPAKLHTRDGSHDFGLALQILLAIALMLTFTGNSYAAASCPTNVSAISQSGYASSASSSGSVNNASRAAGAPANSGTTASTSNSAKLNGNGGTLILDLGDTVPGGVSVTLSLARVSSSSRAIISTSLDNSSYSATTTLSSTAGNNTLAYISYTVPSGGARYLRLVYNGAAMWIDGVSYSQICPPADFGDAPDTGSSTSTGNYQTKSSDNGPSHRIIAGLSIGAKLDADNGSLQNATADADDTTGEGDEDGLINPPIMPTTANQPYTLTAYVTNNTNEAAYLTTYIDFNRDGDFLDAGEKADTQYIYSSGYYYPTFTLPSGLTAGTTYARLRLSQTKSEAESPTGPSSSGEVEDYKLTVSSSPYYDFGDAPASYGAARHTISNNLRLGDNPADAETASYYSFNANGDNYDEDGAPHQSRNPRIALFPILKMTATSYSVDIKATNTTGSVAKLYGWIDFDQNGAFQADEAASASVPNNTDGTVTLTWNSIPTDIKLGTTFIRLRLTTDASITTSTPTGNASNGEVEDYPIAVAMDIPPNSPNVTIVRSEAPTCSSTVFTDNFDDLPAEQYFGENTSTTPYVIRNWTATGGGNDTYARTVTTMFTSQGTSVYFGNGFMRRIYPDIGISPAFDGNGKLLAPPTAIELRDDPDDTTPSVHSGEADWGPNPVKLSRTFTTVAGQKYRLYFAAIPEDAGSEYYGPGIMRVDTPSGSIHFKAPGGMEGIQHYQIEFTAIGSSSTISFVNYGHIGTDDHLCDPNSVITSAWCTVGGAPISKNGNELIIDDVTVALASACPSSTIRGFVYVDKNTNNTFDAATESSLGNITVNLYDNNGTTNTTTDDNIVASTSTAADGSYSFNNVSSALHYRIEVDTHDTDLPASASIGTTNPLADVTVSANSTLTNQNFGFDLACDTSAGQFGGMVFRDYNQNGIRDSLEEGIAGVTVTAYDNANIAVANTTTDTRGWYNLSGLTTGVKYRLEYTNLPAGLASGAHGTDSATNTRFITASGSCTAHYGISDPAEYCQANPYIAANAFVNGTPNAAYVGGYPSIHTFPYNATGLIDSATPPASTKAYTSDTGVLWGMAYQQSTKTLYASAVMRRFSGLGSLGTGGIYKMDMSDPTATTGASAYIDVRTIGIPTGNDARNAADSCNSLSTDPWLPSHDVAAWDMVGKVGIGDMDYDETNKRLWLVNLNDRKLYGIANVRPATQPVAGDVLGGYAINLPSPYSCTSGTFRPWAVKYHRGYVYVGGVCDAASDPYTQGKVRGYVLKFDPANAGAGFAYVKDFALDQPRYGYAFSTAQWNGWIPQADAQSWLYYHSPMVGNLEFDSDGSIIVGIIDRAGLQNGNVAYGEPSCSDTTVDYTEGLGDVLRLCKTDTGYLSDGEPGCSTTIPVSSKSGNEYYWGDSGPTSNVWESMNEIASGGLTMVPGKGDVLMSGYDANTWGTNGVAWLNNKTGAADNRYAVSWTTFSKSTGMGELEALCDPAPIEVGNRVWLDADQDGIQDAGETGIANVSVTLACGTDSATTTTDANGEYYFSNAPGGNAAFMDNGESCKLSISNSQASLTGYTLTTQNADGKTDNNYQTDIRDSDAAVSSGNAVISFTSGGAGQNNHSLDFGYKSSTIVSNSVLSGKVWLDSNKDGIQNDGADAYIEGAQVELYKPTSNTVVATATTNASGQYQFTDLGGMQASTAYQLRIAKFDNQAPFSDWGIAQANVGGDSSLDSNASVSGNYWIIAVTSPASGNTASGYDFGFTATHPEGCLDSGSTGVSNESVANAHPSTYDFLFSSQQVTGYCAERTEPDPQNNDSYEAHNSDRQSLTTAQKSKLARLFSAMYDPDVLFSIHRASPAWQQLVGEQMMLDDLLHYMTWYYTFYNENMATLVSTHIDGNSNFTANQITVMKALMQKVADRVAGTNGETQYLAQTTFWLWNMTSSSRQDMVLPARYAAGSSCSVKGNISGIVYTDSNANNILDPAESRLPNITVRLYDNLKTTVLQTGSTDSNGAYTFYGLSTGHYQIEADTADADIPAGLSIGTDNPLTGVAVIGGATTSNQNFGFDASSLACQPPSPTTTGANSSITWNHNPYTPISQVLGGHPVPAILNTGLIASAANEVASNLTVGPTEWEEYTETSTLPTTLAQAISGNKYFQYSFTTQSSLANDHILYGVAMSTLGPLNTWNHSGKYKIQIQFDDNAAFSSPTVIKNLIQIDEDNPTTGGNVSEGPLYGSDYYISHYDLDMPVNLAANKTYYIRFYLYGVSKTGVANSVSNRVILDDLLLKTYVCGAAPDTYLNVGDAVVTEGDSGLAYLNFPVQLSAAAPAGGVSFDYATADDTATTADSDYQAKTGTVTIPAGANGSVISIPVVGDIKVEPNEKLSLNISNVVNAQFFSYPKPPRGTIIDDDAVKACNAASGQFGGIIFQDYNQNGLHENGEIGLAGVTVTAYNSSNATAATATTDANGWYVLTGLTNGSQYRLEFSNLPTGVESGAAGVNSGSNVQFITASATCDANMGVYSPVDYCQADPKLLTSRYVNGDTSISTASMAGTFGALLSYGYSASGIAPSVSQDALGSQVGGIWGLAYNRNTKKAFASAVVRRHMGMGPLGIGGIYVVDYSAATPTVSNFLNVDGLAGIDVGSINSNTARGLAGDPFLPSHDPTVFDKVGKEGLGDLELSDDGNTLYAVNLYSRKIIKIDLTIYNSNGTVPSTATEISLPSVSCNNGVARPFGLKYYRGKLYAGITCTGENGGSSSDLKAYVEAYDGSSWAEKLQIPLNYSNWHADHMRASEYLRNNIPWVSNFSTLKFGDHGTVLWADDSQLLLSGIEFDANGDMLLGFIDRTGLQFGQVNYSPDVNSTAFYGVFSNGELLKAPYNASTGTYTLENAGVANGIAGEGAKTGADPAWPYGGIGGGEFYGGDRFLGHTENSFGALAVIPGRQELALNAMNPFNVESGGTLWLDNNTGTRTRGAQLYAQDNRYFGKAVGLGDIEALCDTAPIEVGNRVWLDSDKDGVQDANESGINNVTVTLACGASSATTTTNAAGEYYFSNKTGGNASFMKAGASCTLKVNSSQASLSNHVLTTQNADGKTDNNRFTDIRDSDAVNNAGTAEISFTVGGVGQNNHGLDFGYQPISSALAATATCDESEISIDISHLSSSDKALINLTQGAAGTQSWIKTADASGTVTFKTPRTSNGSYTALLKVNTADKTAEASADCPAIASNGNITGVAFRDFNANGVLDNGAVFNEVGVADITVKAFDTDDPANAPSATATTDASGNYSLAGLTDGTTYRIEFSGLRPGDYPSRAPSSNIQFHVSPASNVNFGIISANSYYRSTTADDSNNSEILTSIMTNGDQSTGTERTLVSIPYNASAPWQGDVSAQAMDTDTGSIYGIAYQPQTDRIFSGAYLKRHAGLGPAGLDAIYVTQRGTNSTSVFVELQDDLGINVGSISSNASRGLGNKNAPSHDVDAFNLAGTIGIGDVDISEDGETLYVTNLFDKTLYAIKIDADNNPATRPTPADVTAYPIPVPALCNIPTTYTNMRINMGGERYEAADAEIWMRSSFHLDGQYGSVSNAVDVSAAGAAEESIYQTFMDYVSKIEVPLPNGTYTIKLHYADFWGSPTGRNFDINFENGQLVDPAFNIYNAAGGNGKAVVKSYDVTVNDGMLNIDFTANKQSVLISGMEIIGHTKVAAGNWRPFAIGVEGESVFVGGVCDAATSQNPMYLRATVYQLNNNTGTFQQALSTSLDYNRGVGYSTCDGQHGWFGWLPANSYPSNCDYSGNIAVYPQPILSDIEFAADRSMLLGFRDRFGDQVGQDNYRLSGTTTMTGSASGDVLRADWSGGSYHLEKNASVAGLISAGAGNMQGPLGGEFYYQDNFGDGHAETSMGGLASHKGFNQLLYSRINPEDTVRTAGIGWLNNTTGEQERGYMLYNQSAQFLGKAAGLGDVEIVLEPTPIEVGDRVWLDSDSDGIQDANETGISNVSVKLTCGSDSATTTTNPDGEFYFSNAVGGNAVFMNPGKSCFLSVDGNQASVSSYFLSTQNADGQTDNNAGSDIRDSDAVTSGSHAIINFTAGNSGQNNYGLDFGYQPSSTPTPSATIYTPPSYSVCKSTSVEQLDAFQYATATGSGAAGTPSLTYTAPAGSNRFMVVLLSVERDHTPVSNGRGDNFETNPGVTFPTVTYGGVTLPKLAHSVDASGTSNNFADAETSRSYYLYGLTDLSIPSGANSLQVSGINAPANAGDDAILAVATFANVASVNPISSVVNEYSQTVRTAPFSISLPASPAAPTAADQPPGTSAADNMLLAFGASSKPETLTIGAGWSKLAEIPVTNPNGTFATASGRASGPFSENDGHTLLVQAIKGVSGNQTAAMGSASTNLASLGMQVYRFVAHGCDYGDAPASYGDAFHSQSWSRRIGAQRGDAETATPTATNASGDDSDKLDDEDGVTIPALTAGQSATINVTVAGSAYLSAWVDWNGDGDFADAGEKIATDLQDSDADGTIQIPVSVPATATTSQTYARFRWSINTGAGPTGWGSYGEVEDHSLTVAPNACLAPTASNAWSDELVEWMHNADTPPGASADTVKPYIRQPTYAASAGNETFNNLSVMVKDTVGYVTPSSVPSTVNTSKYIAYSFTTPAFTGAATLYGVGLGHYDQLSGAYKLKVQIDTDPAFGSPTTLINSISIDDTQHSLDADTPTSSTLLSIGWYYFNHYQADQAEVLAPNTTYYVRVYPYNVTRTRYYSALGQNYVIYDDFVLKVKGCGTGTINGSVYLDNNGNNSYDSATEPGIGSITVNLLSDVDGSTIATGNTRADGSYEFSGLNPSLIYRLSVNTTDTDLPAGATIGTANPLTGVTVTAGGTTSKKDFGFDPPVGKNLSGKVFDDVNYGGGTGRAWGTAGTAGVTGAKVELYGSSGAYIGNTTTANDGSYTFKTLAAGKYYVRVVNDTVRSTRSGSDGTERGIQTYRTDGSTAVVKEVGGRKPNSVDTAANTTGQTLDTTTFLLSGGGQAQSVQPITMASSDISGVNFGFNFSTVVNANDSGQGSLRQGILNINLLANTGLAQAGQDNTYGLDVSVIKEVLLFNIPASGDPLGRANICGGSICKITVSSQLPAVAKQPAIIDATTQPGYVAGTPGAPLIQIAPVTGLDATGFVIDYDAPDSTFRGFAITGFQTKNTNRGLTINSERTLVESNYIGVTPTGTADGNGNGIELQWTQTAVIGGSSAAKRNIISANKALGVFFNTGASGSLIQNNYIGTDPTGTVAMGNGTTGIDTEGGYGTKILDNIIAGNQNNGIELGFTSGGPGLANAIIQGNRIGVGVNGEAIGNGAGIMDYGVSGGHAIGGAGAGAGNIIAYNTAAGVSLANNSVTNVVISANSIYANGGLGIDLGNNGVTVNDANDADSGANTLLNFPVLQQITLSNGNIVARGCAPAGAVVEFFKADVSLGGAATPGANRFGLSTDYGEGQTYVGSLVEGSAADSDAGSCSIPGVDGNNHTGMQAFQFSVPVPANLAEGDYLTATATLAAAGTSEFGPTTAIIGGPPPVGSGSCAATGGSDILFIVDNSGSITTSEYADFSATIKTVGSQLLADNPANRIATAHFGGPPYSLVSGGQYVYIERDFSNAAMSTPVRRFGVGGAYNSAWSADHLAGALQQIRYALDGKASTASNYIVSPLKEMSHNTSTPLQIVLMTDAVRYGDGTPSDISMLIDPVGSGAEPNDGSSFTIYNQLKAEGVSFSVVSFNPNPTDIAASAAIASAGGAYTGKIEANPKDPEGSQATPRRFISVTAGFKLTAAQIDELVEGTAICSSTISGVVFDDVNYGGGNGRAFGATGTAGIAGATVEVYDSTGAYVANTTTSADGSYKLPNLPDADYFVRVVSDTVNSSRANANGSELGVMTYRSNGTTAVLNEIGGRKPASADGAANSGSSTLNTSTLVFSGGALAGKPAQVLQKISLTGSSVKNVDFGFNFDTVVNANDSGQGSLRQFLLNANLLGGDTTLAQSGRPAGVENAILLLSTSDPNYNGTGNYWNIALKSQLPVITSKLTLDGSTQSGFVGTPVLRLNGSAAGSVNGLTLTTGSDHSLVKALTIQQFGGTGVLLNDTAGNMIGGPNNGDGNVITGSGGSGVAVTGNAALDNTILGNSIYANGGLGIDLANDGVTANDSGDADSGPNSLLNYPETPINAFGTNGTRVITYDLTLDVPAGSYRLEVFTSAAKDPSGNGEGQTFLGYKDITHPGTGAQNFKGVFNANQPVASGAFIAATLTRKGNDPGGFGPTSEFSGVRNSAATAVCTELTSGSGADMVVDENYPTITFLKAKDSNGNPINYVVSGGADKAMFTITAPVTGATLDCATVKFIEYNIIITRNAPLEAETRAIVQPDDQPNPGDYELPLDSDKNNVYQFQITATYADGQRYTRDFSVQVSNVNEAPAITSATAVSFNEDSSAAVLDIASQDPDAGTVEGNGLAYSITGGADARLLSVEPASGVLKFRAPPDYDAPTDTNRDNVYEVQVTVTDSGGLSESKLFRITVVNNPADDGALLNVKTLLQGAYDSSSGLMSGDLNALGLLPSKQPYTAAPFNYSGTETLSSLVQETTGNSAIVDWVLVDLRTSPTSIAATRALMLRRDGQVVDAQTGSPDLHFANVKAGNYYVSVRHRNHLGAITASPLSLDHSVRMVNFASSSTAVRGDEARLISGKTAMLWAGDVNGSNTLTANGPGNDVTSLLSGVITAMDNLQGNTNHIMKGYLLTDLNLDGKTLFTGPGNDTSLLMGNIILHPLNPNFAANYIVRGGLSQ